MPSWKDGPIECALCLALWHAGQRWSSGLSQAATDAGDGAAHLPSDAAPWAAPWRPPVHGLPDHRAPGRFRRWPPHAGRKCHRRAAPCAQLGARRRSAVPCPTGLGRTVRTAAVRSRSRRARPETASPPNSPSPFIASDRSRECDITNYRNHRELAGRYPRRARSQTTIRSTCNPASSRRTSTAASAAK